MSTCAGCPHRYRHNNRKDNHADPIIKQGLTRNFGLKVFWHFHRFKNREHSNWVCRADQRAKNQRPNEGKMDPEQLRRQPHACTNNKGRDQHANTGHQANRPFRISQPGEVHMQRARKQQEAQHAFHHGLIEINL